MVWFKVDDKLHSHKKAVRADTHAMGLWVLAGSWCADQLTDGFVPAFIVRRLDPDMGEQLADRLEAADLWEAGSHDGDEGWWFKDWSEFQPTSDDVEARRQASRERQERSRKHRSGDHSMCLPDYCDHVTDVSRATNASVTDPSQSPDPTRPDPNPSTPTTVSSELDTMPPECSHTSRAKPEHPCGPCVSFHDEFWPAYPARDGRKVGKGETLDYWRRNLDDGQRAQAIVGAHALAKSGALPKDPIRFLRPAARSDLHPFEEWADPPSYEDGPLARAVADACSVTLERLTADQRRQVDDAARQLRGIDATPGEVAAAARGWRARYADTPLTPSALTRHFGALGTGNGARAGPVVNDDTANRLTELFADPSEDAA